MNKVPSISDALREVVAATEAAIISDTTVDFGSIPKKVYFMHGHPKEIVNVLQAYTNSPTHKNSKYPLIALMRDMPEDLREGVYGFKSDFKCRIVICTLATPTDRANDREVKNFKPILHPVLTEFVNQLSLSAAFGTPTVDELKIRKWDRYFWGSQAADKNVLNDCIDAVEIESISLKLIGNNCP